MRLLGALQGWGSGREASVGNARLRLVSYSGVPEGLLELPRRSCSTAVFDGGRRWEASVADGWKLRGRFLPLDAFLVDGFARSEAGGGRRRPVDMSGSSVADAGVPPGAMPRVSGKSISMRAQR